MLVLHLLSIAEQAFGWTQVIVKPRMISRRTTQSSFLVSVEPRTHKIVIEEFCQIGRLEIKFGRLEII